MEPINDRIDLLRICPSLSDSCILARNPEMLNVAWFIYSMGFVFERIPLFEDLGIKTLDEYVRLVDKRTDFRANRAYQLIRESLPWRKPNRDGLSENQ